MRYSSDIVVIDLEASCPVEDEGNNSVERSNIIEIGAVRLDRRSLEVTATFSELVRPDEYPVTPFITRLTSITPEMVADKQPEEGTEAPQVSIDPTGETGTHQSLEDSPQMAVLAPA